MLATAANGAGEEGMDYSIYHPPWNYKVDSVLLLEWLRRAESCSEPDEGLRGRGYDYCFRSIGVWRCNRTFSTLRSKDAIALAFVVTLLGGDPL